MSLYFHKKAIRISSSRLSELLKTYEANGHGKKVDYPEDDQERHDKCAANLISLAECLDEVKEYTETLESKVDNMEQVFMGIKSKTEQKEWIAEIEEFEKESEYSEIVNESANFVLREDVASESSSQNVQEDEPGEFSTISNESANTQTLPWSPGRISGVWAVFETLIHENDELSTVEKIVHLKESLKGAAEKAIRGIKPVPAKHDWNTKEGSSVRGNQ
ncbi:unnamed protein product [Cylicocyclus nassatus]|uniref:Uncharacterized protein n=1 Tax=Cylicocyclus nassatus TaxID=53992 RepID=A0AA36GZX2_CYLNA|nr:unnamed protein product [Cylicocyclus nassatus]